VTGVNGDVEAPLVSVGDVEVAQAVVDEPGGLFWAVVAEMTEQMSLIWQVQPDVGDRLPRGGWRRLRYTDAGSVEGIERPITAVLGAPIPDAPGRWLTVTLTGWQGDRRTEWLLTSTGVESRLRPIRAERAHGVELRWPPGTAVTAETGTVPEMTVLLHNTGDVRWRADPDDSAAVIGWLTNDAGEPPWPGGWFSYAPSTDLPDLHPGESAPLDVSFPRHSLRETPAGRYGVQAMLTSLGLRSDTAAIDVIGDIKPLPPRGQDYL